MRADSLPLDPARIAVLEVEASRGLPVNPEFVAMVSGGDVRMAAGLDVRIDADGRRGAHTQPRRLRGQQIQFRGRFHIEKKNARAQRLANFFARFPDAGKNDPISRHADSPQAIQLPARNDVESAAERGKHAQDAQIRIGFHRVANRVRKRAERGVHAAIGLLDARAAVQIRGRSESLRGCVDGYAFAIESRPAIGKSGSIARRIDHSGGAGSTRMGRRARSLDFHHHQRAIVRDGASLA